MLSEAIIRDFLASNLALIEPGLIFKSKEFSLENDFGAGGRIDILAKDQFGIFVIIEIKKSNTTARQALHELQKYIALFRTNYGLVADKCRCILVSTEWHELLVPFSEFSRSVDYQVDGYKLILDETGVPIAKESINLAPEGEEKFLFPLHNILLFEKRRKRNAALKALKKELLSLNIRNYYILSMEYKGSSKNVIFPFSLWLVLYMFNSTERKEISKTLGISEEISDEEFDIESSLEEEAFCEVNSKISLFCDDVEAGKPESLVSCLSQGWTVEKVYRSTRSRLGLPLNDEEILKELTSFDAGNFSNFISITTSRIEASWEATCKKLKCFLRHNEFWNLGAELFLDKIRTMSNKATVSIKIYDQCDILFGLYNFYCRGVHYLPTLEIVAQVPEENKTLILYGYLEWDEKTLPTVKSVFGTKNPYEVFLREQLFYKIESIYNLITMDKHGISYSLFEVEVDREQRNIKKFSWDNEENIVLLPTNGKKSLVLSNFFKENNEYLISLCNIGNSCFAFFK